MPVVSDYTAILSGSSFNGTTGTPAFISFSFPTSVPAYLIGVYDDAGLATFQAFSEAAKTAARAAISAWSAVSGITFFEVAPGEGDIKFMGFNLDLLGNPTAAGFAYYPSSPGVNLFSSDVFIDLGYTTSAHVLLHEVGHALGLKHSFEGSVTLAPSLDNYSHTVMSYTSGGFAGTTLGDLDVAAIRAIYGTEAQKGTGSVPWSWDALTLTLTQTGTASADTIFGIGGTDMITGGLGNDRIYGREGAGTIDGGGGDDIISAGTLATIIGGDGNDQITVHIDTATLAFHVDGGIGTDSLAIDANDFGGSTISIADALSAGSTMAGIESISINFGSNGVAAHTINGSSLADSIYGSTANDTVQGLGGDDFFMPGGGTDSFAGGDGNDSAQMTVFSDQTAFTFDGGTGTDTLTLVFGSGAPASFDIDLANLVPYGVQTSAVERVNVFGNGGNEIYRDVMTARGNYITAGAGNDVIYTNGWHYIANTGMADNSTGSMSQYIGGDGDDVIHAGHSKSFLSGGAGADTFVYDWVDDLDATNRSQLEDFQTGLDHLDLTAFPVWNLAITPSGASFNLGGVSMAGTFSLFVRTSMALSDIVLAASNGGTMAGGTGNDPLNGDALDNYLDGKAGADVLHGGAGNDLLSGGTGADELYGEDGNDKLLADASDTVIDGGTGTDKLVVTGTITPTLFAGIETVEFSGGGNLVLTSAQFGSGLPANAAFSGTGTLTVNLASGDSFIAASLSVAPTVAVVINGSAATNIVKVALGSAVTINGGASVDQLRGSNMADTISGGGSNDKIMALGGADVLSGGAGSDQFRYMFAGDSGLGAASDHITDFLAGTDKIDLRLLDPDLVAAGKQPISYIGTSAFHATGAAEVHHVISGANLLVEIDLDGNGAADMQIVLDNAAAQVMSAGDFML